VLMRDY